ncbi:MAG: hypothetical protein ABSD20_14465 [Terriglobales bacterium]
MSPQTSRQFPIDCRVVLTRDPASDANGPETGEVTGYDHETIVVYWPLWGDGGRYQPEALRVVQK